MNLSILKEIALSRKRSLLILAFLFLAAIFAQLYLVMYQKPKLEKARSEWVKLRDVQARGVARVSRDEIYRSGESDFKKFRERIYAKNQFARFVGELYDIAGRNRLEVSSVTYKPEINKENSLLQYVMAISISGSYGELKKFIADIDSAGNMLHVDSVSFSSQGGGSDLVQLQLQLTTYFRTEAQ